MQPDGIVRKLLLSIRRRFNYVCFVMERFPESGKKLDILGNLYRRAVEFYFLIRELELWLKIVMDNGQLSAPEFEAVLRQYARRLLQIEGGVKENCRTLIEQLSVPDTQDRRETDQVDVDLEHSTQDEETRQLEEELTRQMADLDVQFDQEDAFTGN